eukprot:CAMPEP_0205998028 /NCGR_PEP_ID=MMETSP1464-20131121/9_1 /ASSEMBLY_ACC=CAM_ASM_001124 /TAXON_ID=119497 /ORGANISM="Exanthemachrysis gayraliae, Strain RCC1523" /LENGTH=73 /DNA_ID=CAMNT_0053371165 /DNA_START=142 /DNA_END=363 /DNA_ORIENTATION=+
MVPRLGHKAAPSRRLAAIHRCIAQRLPPLMALALVQGRLPSGAWRGVELADILLAVPGLERVLHDPARDGARA